MSKKIGVLTGGGDCPGLNAVIRGITKTAMLHYGWEVVGIMDGFLGMIESRYKSLSLDDVSGILTQGGTILGSTNKANPFEHVIEVDGNKEIIDVSGKCAELYHDLGLSALICLGGDGTQSIGGRLSAQGVKVVGADADLHHETQFGHNAVMFHRGGACIGTEYDRHASFGRTNQPVEARLVGDGLLALLNLPLRNPEGTGDLLVGLDHEGREGRHDG